MSTPIEKMRKSIRLACPFCKEWVKAPKIRSTVFSPEGCLNGQCDCGAVFVVDDTGRLGGQALLDAQAILSGNDPKLAMGLETGRDVEVESRPYQAQGSFGRNRGIGRASLNAKAWFVRRIGTQGASPDS